MSTCPVVKIKPSHPSQGDFVEINESDFDPTKHERFVEPPPVRVAAVPPPPVSPVNPLDSLGKNWRDRDDLRMIAASVIGRTVENKRQAIEVIEAALKARG